METTFQYKPSISFHSFIFECLTKLNLSSGYKVKDFEKIVNPKFDNLLYVNGYEIYITKNFYKYTFKVSKIDLHSNVETQFGCELETCMILDCSKPIDSEISKILLKTKQIKSSKKKQTEWTTLVHYHLKTNIIPFLSEKFLNKFAYAYIVPYKDAETGVYVSMKTGEIIESKKELDSYRTLFFVPDSSVKCKEEKYSFPCEIVTPILASLSDLRLLLEGLINKNCNLSNYSAGFHVNVSGKTNSGKLFPLTTTFNYVMLKNWMQYEKQNYFKLRGEGSVYAKSIENKLRNLGNLGNSENFLNIIIDSDSELSDLDLWYGNQLINIEKYISMTEYKRKNIIEFRIFPSKSDINLLIEYTNDALNVFKKSIKEYKQNYDKLVIDIQKTYLKYKFRNKFTPFKELKLYDEELHFLYNYTLKPEAYYKLKPAFLKLESKELNETESYVMFSCIKSTINSKTKNPEYDIKYYQYKITRNNDTDFYHLYDGKKLTNKEVVNVLKHYV